MNKRNEKNNSAAISRATNFFQQSDNAHALMAAMTIRRKAIEKRYRRVKVMAIGGEVSYTGPTADVERLWAELQGAGFKPGKPRKG